MRVWGRERRIARCPQGVPAPAETIGSTLCARHGRRAALDGSPAKPSKPAWGATSGGGPSDDIDRRRRFPRGGARCPTLAACVTTVYRDGHAPDGYRRPTAGRGGAGRDGGAPNSRGWWRRWRRRDAPHAGQRPGAGGAPPRRCAGRPRPSGGRRSAVSDGSSCWLRHERLSSPSAGAPTPAVRAPLQQRRHASRPARSTARPSLSDGRRSRVAFVAASQLLRTNAQSGASPWRQVPPTRPSVQPEPWRVLPDVLRDRAAP